MEVGWCQPARSVMVAGDFDAAPQASNQGSVQIRAGMDGDAGDWGDFNDA
jgi:hypothetical protein